MSLQGLISPVEPRNIKLLLHDLIECPMGYDICLFTNSGKISIERKKIPGDLLSSVTDGRLNRELLAMREETRIQILLLHGVMNYHKDGRLKVRGRGHRDWTKKGITNLFRTIQYVEGMYIEHSRNNDELVQVVHDLQEYFDKKDHTSLKSRSRIQTNWIVPSYGERIIYFYNGLPGVGINGAKKLYDQFPSPMQLYAASIEEIMEVPRMGKSVASGIYKFLRGIV